MDGRYSGRGGFRAAPAGPPGGWLVSPALRWLARPPVPAPVSGAPGWRGANHVLDPSLPTEVDELEDRRHCDQAPRVQVAEVPSQLGDVLEVLTVEADDERRQQQH